MWRHTGHGPKETKGNSSAGPGDRLITCIQQGRGRAAVSGSKSSAAYRTSSGTPPVACTGVVPHIIGLRKIPFFLPSSQKFCLLFHGPCVPFKSNYSHRCSVEDLTNHEQHLCRVECSYYLTVRRRASLRLIHGDECLEELSGWERDSQILQAAQHNPCDAWMQVLGSCSSPQAGLAEAQKWPE